MRVESDYPTMAVVPAAPANAGEDPQPSFTGPVAPAALPLPAPSNDFALQSYHPVDQDGHPYVGLVNQAMTCYLNSLIQSLYMTPEFRNILYKWQFNGTVEEASRSIPFQLQKLFALLQTTTKSSLETRDLTGSFGWEGSDAYEQHDVQELFRVMLEALEHRFRKSEEHKSFIQNLYKGTMEDFIKCHGCNREKIREDIFNDLSLAIKEWGATQSFKSLEEALQAFVKPEILSGNNKYKCENCGSYQEAEKGFRFKEFPYLFVIQLKRFTVDYNSGFRVKLNDVVTFPDYLDLNSLVGAKEQGAAPIPRPAKMSYANATSKKPTTSTIDENEELSVPPPPADNGRDIDGWLNKPPTCPEVQAMLAKGKNVYELFAIMIHQGSATGGHYFAYIKNLEQSQWLCFNDTQVKAVDLEEVKKGFGSTGWNNNTNAYLMIYRQLDPERNEKFTRNEDLPEHVMNWLKQWDEEENRQAKEQSRLDSLVKVHCLLNDERVLVDASPYGSVDRVFNRDDTAGAVIDQFCAHFVESGVHVTPESVVLFRSNTSFNFLDMTPVDPEKTIDDLLTNSYSNTSDLYFIMEASADAYNLPPTIAGDSCIEFSDNMRTLDVFTVDISHNLIRSCKRICSSDAETFGSLRKRIANLFPKSVVDGIPCRMVLDNMIDDGSPMKLIDDDSQTVGELLMYRFHNMRFYIDCGDAPRLKADRLVKEFIDSQMCRIIEKKKFGIHITIQLPSDTDYRQAGLRPPSANGVIEPPKHDSPPVSPISKRFCHLGPLKDAVDKQPSLPSVSPHPSSSIVGPSSSTSSCGDSGYTLNGLPSYQESETLSRFVKNFETPDAIPSYDDVVGAPPASPVEGPSDAGLPPYSADPSDCEMETASPNLSPIVSDNENDPPPVYDQPSSYAPYDHLYKSNPPNDTIMNDDWAPPAANVVRSDAYDDPEYTVDIGQTGYSDAYNCKYVNVVVDHRQYTKKLVEWIGRYLNINPDGIGLAKHYSDTDIKGYDMTLFSSENVKSSFASVSRVTVTLKVPCKPGEKLVRVVEFDLNNESCPDNWPTLFSIPVTEETTFADFKAQCLATLDSAYAEKLDPNAVRLREVANIGAPVLSLNKTFKQRRNIATDGLIALQRVKPGVDVYKVKEDSPDMAAVIVRRFCPSTLEVMPPYEILLPPTLSENGTQVVKKIIADHAKLVPERVSISDFFPMGTFARWPFTRSTLDLFDSVKFHDTVAFPVDFNGKTIYFIDRNETRKTLSEDDRRSLRIRERMNNTSSNTARRTERPLRIQMSSISEDT